MRGIAGSFVLCAGLLLAVPACRLGSVETRPLAGEVPTTVVVWPIVDALVETAEPAAAPSWFLGLAEALARRGYRVVSPALAGQMLVDQGLPMVIDDPDAIGRALRADALLQLRVRDFEVDGDRSLRRARWDLDWRLVSTRGGGVQWSFTHHGNWSQADRDPFDPLRDLDEQQQPPDIVPIGGDRSPGFRDVGDLMAWLHRLAMDHLPERGAD